MTKIGMLSKRIDARAVCFAAKLLRNSVAVLAVMVLIIPAAAQTPAPAQGGGTPNALQGFAQNKDQPIKIEAASFEVRDKDQVATFIGDVHVTQGDTVLKCKTLVVYYEQNPVQGQTTLPAAQPGPGGQSQIRRLEAKGGVVVTQKDQIATGDVGEFEAKTNTITMAGNVVVTQGQNVIRGDRLFVDMTTGVSRVESGKAKSGRVEALFAPNAAQPGAPGSSPAPQTTQAPAPSRPAPVREPPKAAPSAPLKLN